MLNPISDCEDDWGSPKHSAVEKLDNNYKRNARLFNDSSSKKQYVPAIQQSKVQATKELHQYMVNLEQSK